MIRLRAINRGGIERAAHTSDRPCLACDVTFWHFTMRRGGGVSLRRMRREGGAARKRAIASFAAAHLQWPGEDPIEVDTGSSDNGRTH